MKKKLLILKKITLLATSLERIVNTIYKICMLKLTIALLPLALDVLVPVEILELSQYLI